MIVHGVFSGIHQRNLLFQRPLIDLCSKAFALRLLLQFPDIAVTECRKPLRHLAEPFVQLRAGGNILDPLVDCGLLFRIRHDSAESKGKIPLISPIRHVIAKSKGKIPLISLIRHDSAESKGKIPLISLIRHVIAESKGKIPLISPIRHVIAESKGKIPLISPIRHVIAESKGKIPLISPIRHDSAESKGKIPLISPIRHDISESKGKIPLISPIRHDISESKGKIPLISPIRMATESKVLLPFNPSNNSARPQPVYKYPVPVLRCSRLIHPHQAYPVRMGSRWPSPCTSPRTAGS